jgi:hypothetical protein
MVVCRHQMQDKTNLVTANKSFENMAKLKYLRTVPNQNCKEDEMGEACSTHGTDEESYKILVGREETTWKN